MGFGLGFRFTVIGLQGQGLVKAILHVHKNRCTCIQLSLVQGSIELGLGFRGFYPV